MVNLVLDIICWGKYMKLDDSITSLAGIGPKKAQYLDRLGIHTIYDFITHFPRGYEDNRLVTPIADLEAAEALSKVADHPFVSGGRDIHCIGKNTVCQ